MTWDLPPDDDPEPGTGAVACRLFPAGPATGTVLIGRTAEYRRLREDLFAGRNSWFDSAPGFGVTSLVTQARIEFKRWQDPRFAWAHCRLLAVHDTHSVAVALLEALGQLASQAIRRSNVFPETVDKLFSGVRKTIYTDDKHLQTIRLHPGDDPLQTVRAVAPEVNALAVERKCRPVLIGDNLQQLLALREHEAVLQTLREAIGDTAEVSWLLYGANRAAMRRLFLDDGPLAGTCSRFRLRRIHRDVYAQYLADAAQAQWKCFIGRKATRMILGLSGRHPRWFNELCRRLWCSDLPPVIQDVVDEWTRVVADHRQLAAREFERLSPNQRSVLACLASTPTDQPRARQFVRRTRVSSASVGQAIRILAEQGLIDADVDGCWTVSDPVLQWSLHPLRDLVEEIYDIDPRFGLD